MYNTTVLYKYNYFFSSMFFSGKRGAAAMKFHRFQAYVTGVLPQTVFLQL